ncbi:hypothetical protein CC80DRAFT_452250, partial [Byssothecium circinans]
MKIQSLLNPFCSDTHHSYPSSESPTPASTPHPLPTSTRVHRYSALPKRQKIPKDAPIFSEGTKTVGFVNYPPYDPSTSTDIEAEDLVEQHRRFRVFPMGKGEVLKKGVRHIPYNSDKKDFMEKTGRDAFEMFQYTYHIPGEDKEYVVVWDYNVGLVRMTPFFKSLKYTKTVPAKALRENPGLKDISYSITGGALVCQGYWMPYQAAKAVAATFCHAIRWVLTPVFGNDFPSLCLHPKDPNFAKFLIDPAIVRTCTLETDRFRVEGASYKVLASLRAPPPTTTTTSRGRDFRSPNMQFGTPSWRDEREGEKPRTSEESGWGTESDYSDKYVYSPQVSPRSTTWTSVNGSQSPASPSVLHSPTFSSPAQVHSQLQHQQQHHRYLPPIQRILPTSVPGGYYDDVEPLRTKRTHSKVTFGEALYRDREYFNRPLTATSMAESDEESRTVRMGDGKHTRKELDAAEIILQLSAADHSLPPMKRTRRGS